MNAQHDSRVGIIGAGRLGQAVTRVALRAGRSVVIANSRSPESLTSVVSALGEGVSAGTPADAAGRRLS
jgi:predicted dinucleotide-binding enzyme